MTIEKRKRNHRLTIRMTETEYNLFSEKVQEAGCTQQELVLNYIFQEERASLKEIFKVATAINSIGIDINNHLRQIVESGTSENDLEFIRKDLKDIWHYLRLLQARPQSKQQLNTLIENETKT